MLKRSPEKVWIGNISVLDDAASVYQIRSKAHGLRLEHIQREMGIERDVAIESASCQSGGEQIGDGILQVLALGGGKL